MKTFNKRGDGGETSLLYGVRVAKSDPRCEAYGTVDEAASVLALASHWATPRTRETILSLHPELRKVGAELATPVEHRHRLKDRVSREMVSRLEGLIEKLEAEIEMPQGFVNPGGCPSAAALDLARTITRRAERQVVRVREVGQLGNELVLSYLNRLSDLLYTLARYEEKACIQE